jgi:hypothetical protein
MNHTVNFIKEMNKNQKKSLVLCLSFFIVVNVLILYPSMELLFKPTISKHTIDLVRIYINDQSFPSAIIPILFLVFTSVFTITFISIRFSKYAMHKLNSWKELKKLEYDYNLKYNLKESFI